MVTTPGIHRRRSQIRKYANLDISGTGKGEGIDFRATMTNCRTAPRAGAALAARLRHSVKEVLRNELFLAAFEEL